MLYTLSTGVIKLVCDNCKEWNSETVNPNPVKIDPIKCYCSACFDDLMESYAELKNQEYESKI